MWVIYPALGVFGAQLIGLFGLKSLDSSVGQGVYSIVVGGVVAGITIAFALDMTYRFVFAQAQKRPVNLKRMLKK